MNVRIEFPLPYKMPVVQDVKIVSSYEEQADYRMEFTHEKYSSYYSDQEEVTQNEISTAIIDYSPLGDLKNVSDLNEIFRFAVINSLAYLNHFIDGLRFAHKIHYIGNIAISDLPTAIILRYDGNNYGYITSPLRELQDDFVADKYDIGKVLKYTGMWDKYPEIEIVDKFFINALHYIYREDFVFAIFQLQTSFEVFVRNSYRIMLLSKNASDEVIKKSEKIPFRNLIEHNLSKQLNTNLSFIDNVIINKWYENLYKLRNEIVHKGRTFVTGDMAYAAYDAYVSIRDFIADLMVDSGFLSEEDKLNLNIFERNIRGKIDEDKVSERLVEKGFIKEGVPTIKI